MKLLLEPSSKYGNDHEENDADNNIEWKNPNSNESLFSACTMYTKFSKKQVIRKNLTVDNLRI